MHLGKQKLTFSLEIKKSNFIIDLGYFEKRWKF